MNRSQRRAVYHGVLAAFAAAALVIPARAQEGPANIRSLSFYTVKPDRIGDFQAEIKEYEAVLTKAGAGASHYHSMWHSLTGPNEYVLADYSTKWADFDSTPDPKLKEVQADLQRIGTRITQCTESLHRIIEEVLPDLSLPGGAGVPKMISVLRSRVRPDKVDEYLGLVKNEVLPAAKKSGLTVFSVSRVRYGAPTTEFISVAGLSKWADLDGGFGVPKGMGEEGYQRFLEKIRPLLVESEYAMYRFQPDLSYLPAAGSSAAH